MKKTTVAIIGLSLIFPSFTVFAESKNEGKNENKSKESRGKDEKREENKEKDDDFSRIGVPYVSHVNEVKEKSEKLNSSSLSKIAKQGRNLIRERINALTDNQRAIDKAKDLTTEQKKILSDILNLNITKLTVLGNSIASSTDATTTKALVESIYTQHRIYGIVIPQVRLEKRIFDLQNYVSKINATFVKVEAKIAEWKGKGKDVTVWQKNLVDAKALVAADTIKLSTLLTQAQALTPAMYGTSSKTTIDSINQGLKLISKDFNTIGSKIRQPRDFKNVVVPVATSTTATSTSTTATTTNATSTSATTTTR